MITKFQFHTGSIKRRNPIYFLPNIKSFNSILVRLKALDTGSEKQAANRFQFHTGSIKSISLNVYDLPLFQFQFHTGSIKSLLPLRTMRKMQMPCFNSILVRLKVPSGEKVTIYENGFNSILVRLKDQWGFDYKTFAFMVSIPYWFD